MNHNITGKLLRLLSRRELKMNLARLARVLSCVAVFCITYILVAPVLTEEWPAQCGMEEHVHDDSCYEEQLVEAEPELVCTEPEGHVHTTECYAMSRGDLMCTETGTEEAPHEHDDNCYAWSYELTCTEPEGHTHTEACRAPAGEPAVQRVLICTLPEHTHVDSCYHVPEENPAPEYHCGFLTEHEHTEACYFESGDLKCTVPEHLHTDACLEETTEEVGGETLVTVPVDGQFTYENEMVSITVTVTGDAVMEQPGTAPEDGEAAEEAAPPEETAVPELVVTEAEDMDAYNEYEELAEEEGDVMLLQVLNYGLTLDGAELDLSNCEVTVEAVPTQQLQEMMDAPQDVGLMTVDAAGETDGADETGEAAMGYCFSAYTERRGTVAYSVILGANPTFKVQYYANIERVATEKTGDQYGLDMIDTEKIGGLPVNGKTYGEDQVKYVYLEGTATSKPNNNGVAMDTELTEIYREHEFAYLDAPNLRYFNIVTKDSLDGAYKLKEIWVMKPNGDPESDDLSNWDVYPYDANMKFTNRPEALENVPTGETYILIQENTVLRLIYDPVTQDYTNSVNFYDYDITDGFIYEDKTDSSGNHYAGTQMKTSEQNEKKTYISKIGKNGINSTSNYSGKTGAKLAFGNSIGTGWENEAVSDHALNKKNGTKSYEGCHFGIVTGLNPNGKLIYNSNIAAPNLFNDGSATGKTSYENGQYTLDFNRVGDTYTLSAVKNQAGEAVTGDLSAFNYLGERWGSSKLNWSNNFWPMDTAESYGTDGHDLKFGGAVTQRVVKNDGSTGTFNNSDNKQNHNSYFGMNFAVSFQLTKDYIGPLEYYFFGDDDMWVFLSKYDPETKTYSESKLICDIGGVHQAVGEYVNLWDHITGAELSDEPTTYALSFFYTERGASGSTCWMQFTLPTVVGVDLESQLEELIDKENGALWIEKTVEGIGTNDKFTFQLELFDKDGEPLLDNYQVLGETVGGLVRDETGAIVKGDITDIIHAGGTFTLEDGGAIAIYNLPAGATYEITEVDESREGYSTTYTIAETRIKSGVEGEPSGDATQSAQFDNSCGGTISANIMDRVSFTNRASYELPATGGPGTVLWYCAGLGLLTAALYLFRKNRKRGTACD